MRKAAAAFALSAVLALAVAALAGAASTRAPIPQLILAAAAAVSPKAVPRKDYVPVSAHVFGKIKTSDGTHPSALREAIVDVDKDVRINARRYPSCDSGRHDLRGNPGAIKRACGEAILGSGDAHIEIAYPEREPILEVER
jgi:hypothetical protein